MLPFLNFKESLYLWGQGGPVNVALNVLTFLWLVNAEVLDPGLQCLLRVKEDLS